jgi:N-acetylneuraminic acid mutarotase
MPTARRALTAAFIDGILYAVGGYSSNNPLGANEAYSPTDNFWTTKEPMPTDRHHAASAVVDGKMYVMGGRTGAGIVPSVNVNEMYDQTKTSGQHLSQCRLREVELQLLLR